MVKNIWTPTHAIEPKNEICSKNGDDELATIVLSQETVTDSAVRRLVFDAGEDVEKWPCVKLILPLKIQVNSKNTTTILKRKNSGSRKRDQVRNFQPPITGKKSWKFSILSLQKK
jgi:tRNA nucleotidyltransferase (CCA-adding enzyme)